MKIIKLPREYLTICSRRHLKGPLYTPKVLNLDLFLLVWDKLWRIILENWLWHTVFRSIMLNYAICVIEYDFSDLRRLLRFYLFKSNISFSSGLFQRPICLPTQTKVHLLTLAKGKQLKTNIEMCWNWWTWLNPPPCLWITENSKFTSNRKYYAHSTVFWRMFLCIPTSRNFRYGNVKQILARLYAQEPVLVKRPQY